MGKLDTKNNFTGIYNNKIIIKNILKYNKDYNDIDKLKNFKYFTLESYIDIKKMEILKEYFKDSDKWIIASSGINDGLSYMHSFLLSYDKIFKNNIKFPDYENDKNNYENDLENLRYYDESVNNYENIIIIFEKGEELKKGLWKTVNITYNTSIKSLMKDIKIIISELEKYDMPEIIIKDGINREGKPKKFLYDTEYTIIENNLENFCKVINIIIDTIINKHKNILKLPLDIYDKDKRICEGNCEYYILNKKDVIRNSDTVKHIHSVYSYIKKTKEKLIIDFKNYLVNIETYKLHITSSINYNGLSWANDSAQRIIGSDYDIINISDEMFNNISNIYNLNIIILSLYTGKLTIKNIINPEKDILKLKEYFSKYPTVILLTENEKEYSVLYNKNDIITYDTLINIITTIKK